MNFNFGEILSRAWQIIWKHRVLWIFGILASCSQGGSRFNSGNSGRGGNGFGTGPGNLPPRLQELFMNIAQHATAYIAVFIAIICIIWIIAIFLGTIGKIGLIRGASQAEGGEEHLIFGQLFSESTPYFWRMFGLSLVVGLPFLILIGALVAIVVVAAIGMSQGGNNASAVGFLGILPIFFGCLCFLILISIVVGWIVHQAERAIVLEDSPVLPAISRGWEIFRNNLGPIILMAIILGVIGFVAGIIIAIPVLVVVVPAAVTFALGNSQNYTPLIFAGVCLCLYIPVSLLLNGILISYTETAWTLTYLRLTGKPASADILPPAPDNGTPPTPPPSDDGDKTIISSSHA